MQVYVILNSHKFSCMQQLHYLISEWCFLVCFNSPRLAHERKGGPPSHNYVILSLIFWIGFSGFRVGMDSPKPANPDQIRFWILLSYSWHLLVVAQENKIWATTITLTNMPMTTIAQARLVLTTALSMGMLMAMLMRWHAHIISVSHHINDRLTSVSSISPN